MCALTMEPNPKKNLEITVDAETYFRFPIKTPLIISGDSVLDVIKKTAGQNIQSGDTIFISEKIVAIAQGRAFKISDIHPSFLARLLTKFVHKSAYGIGLGSPWTMELALQEVGAARILFAAFVAAITKPFGVKGMFYRVAGNGINAIDGPCSYTIPPYNEYAKLGPKNPDAEAKKISEGLGAPVVIIDANDLGVNVLGRSHTDISVAWAEAVFKDNPLGQASQQTPAAIIRKK